MRKILIAVLVVLMLFVAGCSTTSKSIYDKNMTTQDTNYDNDTNDYTNDAKNFYPDNVLPNDNEYVDSLNNDVDNYFKTNNITQYKYTTTNDTIKVWINNWDNMTQTSKDKIKSDLMKLNTNIKNIEFVKTKNDLE